jgi:hypothetical protein
MILLSMSGVLELARTRKALITAPGAGERPAHARRARSGPGTRRKPRKCHESETDLGVIAVRQAGKPRWRKIDMSRAVRPYSTVSMILATVWPIGHLDETSPRRRSCFRKPDAVSASRKPPGPPPWDGALRAGLRRDDPVAIPKMTAGTGKA